MREIRTSGSMRGGRKHAFAWRACLPLYRRPRRALRLVQSSHFVRFDHSQLPFFSSDTCLRLQLLHEPIPLIGFRNHYSASRASETYALTRASTKEPAAAGLVARASPACPLLFTATNTEKFLCASHPLK